MISCLAEAQHHTPSVELRYKPQAVTATARKLAILPNSALASSGVYVNAPTNWGLRFLIARPGKYWDSFLGAGKGRGIGTDAFLLPETRRQERVQR